MKKLGAAVLLAATTMMPLGAHAEVSKLNIPLGAGGFGFLPLHMMKEHNLIEKHVEKAGHEVEINWANIGGPSAMIDALLSGSADFISAGPPSFLILWDRTKGTADVKGVAAISSMPMSLNTRAPHLQSIDDLKPDDKIAVTSVKSSIPSIIMQMYAMEKYGKDEVFRFDPYTVSMSHGDAAAALLSGSGAITAHYASSPLSERELKNSDVRSIQNTDDVMGGSTTFTMVSTTKRFRDSNPTVYAAFVDALQEAQAMIEADKEGAAKVLIASMGGSGSVDEMLEILNDPKIKYTTTPENVMKYATFMHEIGSLENKAEGLEDLFFPGPAISSGN